MTISIIRDTYKGNYMARVMSFVTAFFILVPVVAPAIGKVILDGFGWEAIFYLQLLFTLVIVLWFWKRQQETLRPEYKIPFTKSVFSDGFREFIKYPDTVAFTLVSGFITGAFLVYLSASQHIFETQYQLKDAFPYIFAGLAVSIGLSTFTNGTLVLRFGMRKLSFMALLIFCLIAFAYVFVFWDVPNPSIVVLVAFLSLQFFCLGFLWGNFRAIAMEPVGHIAGIAAAINGFISTLFSVPIATLIGQYIEDTVWPMFLGLAICGTISLLIFIASNRKKRLVAKVTS